MNPNEKIPTRLLFVADSLYFDIIEKLDSNGHPDEEQYIILRYLTNYLESKEAEIYKKIQNENH